ncbi:cysteine desulfurase family protein [Paenibacillus ferrarius]|uniref:cysteine desulfurase family protein n=1 Tax=Paenibacillus ferrarius TaxID=1469647 RepID=UPI003D291B68
MLYMDYAATSPLYNEVVDTIAEVMKRYYGNPSSIHRLGVEAENVLKSARSLLASSLGAEPSELICTSGGTESNNLAIKGIAYAYRHRGLHLITTAIEHPSVQEVFAQLAEEGFRVTVLPVTADGYVRPEDVQAAICEDTILVSVMYVNNEVGTIQPIQAIGRLLAAYPKIAFHVDAVQGFGKLPLYPKAWGIDLLSASAHKFRGPKGVGFLYCREGLGLRPLLAGGGQERGVRSGTENVPLIVGMAKALRLTLEGQADKLAHVRRLSRRLTAGIAEIPELVVTCPQDDPERMAAHIVHFTFPGMKAEVVVHAFEQRHIFVSTKSACASGESEPSGVLLAMGRPREQAISGVRVSLSETHQEADVALFLKELRSIVKELSPMRSGGSSRRGKGQQ